MTSIQIVTHARRSKPVESHSLCAGCMIALGFGPPVCRTAKTPRNRPPHTGEKRFRAETDESSEENIKD